MSKIDHLIAEMCPGGVTFKAIGEVGQLIRGNGLQKADLLSEGVGAIHYGQIFTTYGTATSKTKSFVAPSLAARLRRAKSGDLVIATTSENDEDVCKAVVWLGADEIAISGDAFVYSHTLDPLYAAYLFQAEMFQAQKRRFISGTKVKRVSGADLSRIKIPVPPLPIQREIAFILSRMEQLNVELEVELEYRNRQYSYYRDRLLTFHETNGVKLSPMGEVARIARGASPRPIQSFLTKADDGVPWIKIGDVPAGGKYITATAERVTRSGAEKSRRVSPGDFVLSNSMSFGRPYISKIEGCIHDGWLAISGFENSFLPDFLYHLLRSTAVQVEFVRRAGAGTVSNLNAEIVRNVVVPVPARGEQERIIGILDKFETLVNDLTVGLPAEIYVRRQQYGYYRDRLLTFQEAT